MPGKEKFPKDEHLRRKRDFQAVFKNGKKGVGQAFICYMFKRQGQGRKLGLAVSRKVGNAVVRNRVKRFIRETYRTNRENLDNNLHLIVIAKPSAAALNFGQSSKELTELLDKGRAFNG